MKPIWQQVKHDLPSFKYVDIDEDKAHTPGIAGYPTILLKSKGKTVQYRGPADYDQLKAFIVNNYSA
jgi:hypothetical protein